MIRNTESELRGREVITDWPVEQTIYLTLDLECDYGTALDYNTYNSALQTDILVDILERHEIPLTCFLQTEVLDEAPIAIRHLVDADVDVEIHAHSHTHPTRSEADVLFEIETSVGRIRDQFGTEPLGYRFPDGAIDESDYRTLSNAGIAFDASLFPSWRPGRYNNSDSPRYPYRHSDSMVIELPFTVYSERIRIPVALSYLKLLGRPFEWLVHRRPPTIIVFDMHMHDIVVPSSIDQLPVRYRAIYSRNKHAGGRVLDDMIMRLKRSGYTFSTMNRLYSSVNEQLS